MDCPPKFDVGQVVCVIGTMDDIVPGTIVTPPDTLSKCHAVKLENGEMINSPGEDIHLECVVPQTNVPTGSLGFFTPLWMTQDAKITLPINDECLQGHLNLGKDFFWEFVTRNHDGKIADAVPVPDLHCLWKNRLQENSLQLGWQDDVACRVCGHCRHVSAAGSKRQMAPANLAQGLSRTDLDCNGN